MNNQPSPPEARRGIRWWPAGLILVLGALAYGVLRFIPHESQQALNINVAKVAAASIVGLLLWVMLFSRMRRAARLAVLGATLGVLVLLPATFRIRGVSGNLVPILEPRWASRQLPIPASTPPVAARKSPPGAADFPQFLGPNRNGILTGPKLATNWAALPPAQLWRVTVGAGWSGFAVSGAFAITQEQRGEEECVIAYDLQTGRVAWSHADKTRYFTTLAGEGPRATPTIAGQRVFTQGATGLLNCLDLADGHALWSKNVFKENGGAIPAWGVATSPLVLNDLVIVSSDGPKPTSLVAYRVSDGSLAWSSGSQPAGYSSPALATLGGTRQILLFADALTGSDAATGKELWQFPWPGGNPHVAMPVIVSDTDVVISSGYGTGSARVKVARDTSGQWSATQVWRSPRMKAKFTNLIPRHGYIYGLDDGIMGCVDAATGALAWKEGRYGHGQELLVGELLLVMTESGAVVLVDPQPDHLHELTRFTVFNDKTWNPPALAGEYLLLRNDKEAACYRMPTEK
jgi:outer membrane protein assembly factor BamB